MKLAHTLLFEAGMLDEKKKNFKRLPKEATDWGALGFAPILVWDHLGILVKDVASPPFFQESQKRAERAAFPETKQQDQFNSPNLTILRNQSALLFIGII